MTERKIMGLNELEAEMRAVARGEIPAPPDAASPKFESVEALARLLTPENRSLLTVIRDRKPQSIAELAQWTGRAESNLARTLDKLGAMGLLTFETDGRRKVPMATVDRITVEIDPFGGNDRLEMHAMP